MDTSKRTLVVQISDGDLTHNCIVYPDGSSDGSYDYLTNWFSGKLVSIKDFGIIHNLNLAIGREIV